MLIPYRTINEKLRNIDAEAVGDAFAQKVSRSPDAEQITKNFLDKIKDNYVKSEVLFEKHELFVEMKSPITGKYNKVLHKVDALNVQVLRLENMLYLSLRANNMSEYAITGLLGLLKKKFKLYSNLVVIGKRKHLIHKKLNNVLKKMISIRKKRLALLESVK